MHYVATIVNTTRCPVHSDVNIKKFILKYSVYTSSNTKCRERSINSTKNKEKFQIASTGNSLYADVNEEKTRKKISCQ